MLIRKMKRRLTHNNTKIDEIKVLQKHNKYFITSKTRNRKTLNK